MSVKVPAGDQKQLFITKYALVLDTVECEENINVGPILSYINLQWSFHFSTSECSLI